MMNSLMLDALNRIVDVRIEIAKKDTQAFACKSASECAKIEERLDADYNELKNACEQVISLIESRFNDKG